MTRNKTVKPTQAELEILRILWDRGPSSVKDVHQLIGKEKETGYTTTLKIMQNMLEKSLVIRKGEGRAHIYHANVMEEDIQKSLLASFMTVAFGGSAKNLVMQALGNHQTSKEEIKEIRDLLDQIEKKKK